MALMRVFDNNDWDSFEKAYRKSYKVPDTEIIQQMGPNSTK